jgi:hypothetical protein
VDLTAAPLWAQSIEGRVVNSVTGAGIPEVTADIFHNSAKVFSAATDQQGSFRIVDVPEGSYTACVKASDLWPVSEPCTIRPFQVTTAEPAHLEFAMAPIGKISGRVLDAAGNAVPHANLQLNLASRGIFMTFDADEKGNYRTPQSMLPGTWTISAAAPESLPPPAAPAGSTNEAIANQHLGWALTFYPGETNPDFAVPIVVAPGAEIAKLDIKLAAVPVHRVRGVVLDLRGDPVPNAALVFTARSVGLLRSLRKNAKPEPSNSRRYPMASGSCRRPWI